MNVAEMRAKLASLTSHAPDVQSYREDIAEMLSDSLLEIAEMNDWPWLQREVPLWLFPDVTVSAAHVTLSLATAQTYGRQLNVTDTAAFAAALYPTSTDVASESRWLNELVDAEVEAVDRLASSSVYNPWWDAPFTVENVVHAGPATTAMAVYLDPRATFEDLADARDIKFAWRRYRLPNDCKRVLHVVGEDGPLQQRSPSSAAEMALVEQTGTPLAWVDDQGFRPRFAVSRNPLAAATNAPTSDYATKSTVYARANRRPRIAPVLAQAGGGGGNLATGVAYRIIVAWNYGGRYSPASPESTITLTGVNDRIVVTLPYLPDDGYGRRVEVFIAKEGTAFYRATAAPTSATLTVNVDNDPRELLVSVADSEVRFDEVYRSRYAYIRPWPRPNRTQLARVIYQAKPPQLIEEEDEPSEIWEGFHMAIVYHVAVKLAAKYHSQDFGQVMGRLLDQQLRQLETSFIRPDRRRKADIRSGAMQENLPTFHGIDWRG